MPEAVIGCSLCKAGPWEAIGWAVEQLERAWLPVEQNFDPECHIYSALRADQFIEALLVAMSATSGRRYLEVGCGIGTKLMIATRLGLDVSGIDNREQYVAIARYLCPEANVVLADARGFDNFRAFDIIYSYRPLHDREAQARYDRMLVETAPRAVIIAPLSDFTEWGRTTVDRHRFVWVP